MPALGLAPKTTEGAVKLYDGWAATYDETLRSWDYPAPSRTAALLREHWGSELPPPLPVLDAGCGTGLSGEALRLEGFARVLGVDVSDESLEVCRAKGAYESVALGDLSCADGPLGFQEDSFSCVVSVGVLSYVSDFSRLFPELCRVTAPGGLIAFTHRHELWDKDVDGVRSVASALEESGTWSKVSMSEPQPYMPLNPDPTESAKRIRYVLFRVA